MKFKVNISNLELSVKKIEQQILNLETLNTKASATVDIISCSWIGPDSNDFITKIKKQQKDTEKLIGFNENYKKMIARCAKTYKEAQDDVYKFASKLSK
jgi:hypothetical protein